jgi:hypothetical protein
MTSPPPRPPAPLQAIAPSAGSVGCLETHRPPHGHTIPDSTASQLATNHMNLARLLQAQRAELMGHQPILAPHPGAATHHAATAQWAQVQGVFPRGQATPTHLQHQRRQLRRSQSDNWDGENAEKRTIPAPSGEPYLLSGRLDQISTAFSTNTSKLVK